MKMEEHMDYDLQTRTIEADSSTHPPKAVLTDQELEEMKEAFLMFDQNGNGNIDISELGNIMRVLGFNPTDYEIAEFLSAADISGDKVIDFNEFVTMIQNNKHRMNDEQLLKAFRVFDKDGNGFIDRFELKRILMDLNNHGTTEEQVDKMIKEADFNKDGLIDYRELVLYWKCK